MPVTVESAMASHPGHVRETNEDAVLVDPPVFAVADGMGGHARGELASRFAIEALQRFRGATAVTSESVLVAIATANDRIRAHTVREPEAEGMGTTLVGLALIRDSEGDALLGFNVGDSRLYELSESGLHQVSTDHSEFEYLRREEGFAADEAARRARPHVLTRALGADESVRTDTWRITPCVGHRYLLCSDGLTREVSDEQIRGDLERHADGQDVVDALVSAALANGGRDNVSVVVVDVVDVDVRSAADSSDAGDDTQPREAVSNLDGEDTIPKKVGR